MLRWLVAAILLPLAVGCNNSLVPVSGTVRLDGKPLAEAGVVFQPIGQGAVASGTTDAQGQFHLATGSQLGAAPGEYCVTVSKARVIGVDRDERVAPTGVKVERVTPVEYADPATSPLKANVNRSTGTYNFDLTSSAKLHGVTSAQR